MLADDALEQGIRVAKQAARRRADLGIVQDSGIVSGQLPSLEERCPVDVRHQLFEGIIGQGPFAEKAWPRGTKRLPVYRKSVPPGIGYRLAALLRFSASPLGAKLLILRSNPGHETGPQLSTPELARHAHRDRKSVV